MRQSDMELEGFKYESPIQSTIDRMYENINAQFDNGVLRAIAEVGISVDKDELIRALRYDRGQYEKGYADGIAAAEKARPVVQRCKYCRPNDCGGIKWDCSDIGVEVTFQAGKFRISNEDGDEAELTFNFCPNCGAEMRQGYER